MRGIGCERNDSRRPLPDAGVLKCSLLWRSCMYARSTPFSISVIASGTLPSSSTSIDPREPAMRASSTTVQSSLATT